MQNPISQSPQSSLPPAAPLSGGRRWSHLVGAALVDTFGTILPAVLIALLIHLFLAQATRVYGQSMEPNLHENQRLVVEKVSYRLHGPRRGDVVVLHDPAGSSELLIKRVVGLPGERITIAHGHVYIDGNVLDEPYLPEEVTLGSDRASWVVPPLNVFVMGDNRPASRDSRSFGPVAIDQLVGHAVFRYWPLDRFGLLN
jgi:signal peptidase I